MPHSSNGNYSPVLLLQWSSNYCLISVINSSVMNKGNELLSRNGLGIVAKLLRVSRNTAPRRNTCLGFNWISRRRWGNVDTSNEANWRRDETSSYPPLASTSSAVRCCCLLYVRRFLAECHMRQLNLGSFVLVYFRLFTFLVMFSSCTCIAVVFCLWLAVKNDLDSVGSVGIY